VVSMEEDDVWVVVVLWRSNEFGRRSVFVTQKVSKRAEEICDESMIGVR
jgi:hypothetical protein